MWEVLCKLRVDLVLNGHRHQSYDRGDLGPRKPRLLSSPSVSLGDAKTKEHFFWIIDLEGVGFRASKEILDRRDSESGREPAADSAGSAGDDQS